MMQSLFRRSIENAYRCLPLLKKCCRNFETAALEVDASKSERYVEIDRRRERKTYQENFIENLFLGIFEPEVLEYPQIRTKEEVDYLKEHGERANNLILHGIDCKEIESTGKITEETLKRLREKDVIGMKIRLKDEGLGYFESESSYIQESLHLNASVGKFVAEYESAGYQILKLFGTDSQKDEYIQKFLKGDHVPCLAHLENGSWVSQDSTPIMSTAIQEADGSFVISGRKTLVYNPNSSDIFIVSARVSNKEGNNCYTLFMVDKNSKGLSVLEPFNKFSLKGTEICDVVLDNVIVSEDKVIGKVNEGKEVVDTLMSLGKLSNGGYCIGVMRKLVNAAITHCIYNNHFNKPLHKYKYIQGKIGEIVQALYAAESMTYLMTGRVDEDPNLDAKLESLIVKIFNSEALNFILYNYMHLVGKDNCKDDFIEELIRDSPYFTAFDDPNSYLKMIVPTIGVKHTLNQMSHTTVKNYKPKSKMKLNFLKLFLEFENDEILEGYLHLTLEEESRILNHCVKTLNFLTELLLFAHGSETLNKPYYLSQLADLTIIIYKITAVLGRSSRSYCIGVRHSESDIRIARNISQNGYQRALTISRNVLKNLKNEPTYKNIRNHVSAGGKFCHLHPAKPSGQLTPPT